MSARLSALFVGALMAGCAAPNGTARNEASCGSLPPAFDAPILCSSVDKATRTLEVNSEAAYGFSIERAPDANGGLRIPPQTVIPFVRPSLEELE
ncbi:MAG: hypothetical protein Q8R98_12745 [Rubrivivax sp.]|nr:hypothetical protein [Rubrivivax sp.]MDP3612715.1 hypothetical protein [Rubrivivax sp.]